MLRDKPRQERIARSGVESMEERQLDSSGSNYWQTAGCYECGNELSGNLPEGEFLD